MTFIAQYRSACASCESDIQKGDEAKYAAFDEVVHVVCPPDQLARSRELCARCFIELPVSGICGTCDD